jgi:hypothetical protein
MPFDESQKNSLDDNGILNSKKIRSGSLILKIDDLSPEQDNGEFYLSYFFIFCVLFKFLKELKLIFNLFDFDKDKCVGKGK